MRPRVSRARSLQWETTEGERPPECQYFVILSTSSALTLSTLSHSGKPSVFPLLLPVWDCLENFLCSAYVTDFLLPRTDRRKAAKLYLIQVKSCLFLNNLGRQCKGHWLIFFPFPPNKCLSSDLCTGHSYATRIALRILSNINSSSVSGQTLIKIIIELVKGIKPKPN